MAGTTNCAVGMGGKLGSIVNYIGLWLCESYTCNGGMGQELFLGII